MKMLVSKTTSSLTCVSRATFMVIAVAAVLLTPTLLAAQRDTSRDQTPRWRVLGSWYRSDSTIDSVRYVVEVDQTRITKLAADSITLWERTTFASVQGDGIGAYDSMLRHLVIDCRSLRRFLLYFAFYQGDKLMHEKQTTGEDWQESPPESIAETITRASCRIALFQRP